jgi:hypothetical protein
LRQTEDFASAQWATLAIEEEAVIAANSLEPEKPWNVPQENPEEATDVTSPPPAPQVAAARQARSRQVPVKERVSPAGERLQAGGNIPEEPLLVMEAEQPAIPEQGILPMGKTAQNLQALPLFFPEQNYQTTIEQVEINREKANPYRFQHRHLMLSAVAQGAFHYSQRVKFGEAGAGAGLLAHIPLSKHFRLSTGAMWVLQSGKFIPGQERFIFQNFQQETIFGNTFRANRYDFVAGPDIMTMIGQGATVDLVTITGRLQTLEVPVLFTYYLPFRKKNQWYINTGLSGYFHLKETYQYQIETFVTPSSMVPLPPSLTETENVFGPFESGNFASTLYIGAGFEKATGAYSSWGVEPYLKLPLAGMGVEAIPVRSVGVRLRYNFALPLKARAHGL